MKRFISLLLCALMVLSLFTTAFALPTNGDDDATLNGIRTPSPSFVCVHYGGTLYSATCNGTEQTWYYRNCVFCKRYYTSTRSCPAGPHNPARCDVLPI